MARRRPLAITRRNGRRQQSLKTTTLREFGGGWNVIDNDLNLDSRFSRILTNITLFCDWTTLPTSIFTASFGAASLNQVPDVFLLETYTVPGSVTSPVMTRYSAIATT